MLLPKRHASDESYRYGFNGKEKDDELKGEGNSYTTHFRQYDSRLGRWLSIDPVTFPSESPYMAMVNNPINYNDVDGDCPPCAVWAAIKGGEIILGLIVSYAIYDQRENIRDGAGMLAESTYNATANLFSSDPTPSDVVETFPALTRPALEIETFPTMSEKLRSRVLEELLPVRESTQINEGYNSLPLELQLPNIKSIPAFKDENFNHSILFATESVNAAQAGGFISTEVGAQSKEKINAIAGKINSSDPWDKYELEAENIITVVVGNLTYVLDGHNRLSALVTKGDSQATLDNVLNISIEEATRDYAEKMKEIMNGKHDTTIEEAIEK